MAEEHVFDRLSNAKAAEKQAKDEASSLVDRLRKVADQLRNWQKLSFLGCDENGNIFGPMPSERDQNTIDIRDVPDLMAIRNAVGRWHSAANSVHAIQSSLTAEQRQTLGLPPR
jgi:hypothetical protein